MPPAPRRGGAAAAACRLASGLLASGVLGSGVLLCDLIPARAWAQAAPATPSTAPSGITAQPLAPPAGAPGQPLVAPPSPLAPAPPPAAGAPPAQPAPTQPAPAQPAPTQSGTPAPGQPQPTPPGETTAPPVYTPAPPVPLVWQPQGTAVLQVLDKVNAQSATLTIKVRPVGPVRRTDHRRARLRRHPADRSGRTPPPSSTSPTATRTAPSFHGWMLKSDPSVSMLQHPLYDVRVLGCRPKSKCPRLWRTSLPPIERAALLLDVDGTLAGYRADARRRGGAARPDRVVANPARSPRRARRGDFRGRPVEQVEALLPDAVQGDRR